MNRQTQTDAEITARQRWMGVLAKASADRIEPLWSEISDPPRWSLVRPPESGMVMVRARAGGTGQRFNMGEMTVTRCTVRLDDGTVGHAYVAGRSLRHAELAAVLDALLQNDARRGAIEDAVIGPLAAAQQAERAAAARKAAATKVDFFTMVRGE